MNAKRIWTEYQQLRCHVEPKGARLAAATSLASSLLLIGYIVVVRNFLRCSTQQQFAQFPFWAAAVLAMIGLQIAAEAARDRLFDRLRTTARESLMGKLATATGTWLPRQRMEAVGRVMETSRGMTCIAAIPANLLAVALIAVLVAALDLQIALFGALALILWNKVAASLNRGSKEPQNWLARRGCKLPAAIVVIYASIRVLAEQVAIESLIEIFVLVMFGSTLLSKLIASCEKLTTAQQSLSKLEVLSEKAKPLTTTELEVDLDTKLKSSA